jgi:hypothetical protein
MNLRLPWLTLSAAASACAIEREAPSTGEAWPVRLGVPDQRLELAALSDLGLEDGVDRDAWLALSPRVVVESDGAHLGLPFIADDTDPLRVRLEGLYETGDQEIVSWTSRTSRESGLDHDLSFTVRLADDSGTLGRHWIAVRVTGSMRCDAEPRQPRSVAVFDADREPLPWDGVEVAIAGVWIGLEVLPASCAVPA